MGIRNLFVQHPRSVGENYLQHLRTAWSFAWGMLCGGLACMVHGLLPFLFERTASRRIAQLHGRMVVNRPVVQPTSSPAEPPSH